MIQEWNVMIHHVMIVEIMEDMIVVIKIDFMIDHMIVVMIVAMIDMTVDMIVAMIEIMIDMNVIVDQDTTMVVVVEDHQFKTIININNLNIFQNLY
eukprot:jgi/Orpsp1_1/1182373/evm.model.c7180000081021.2